jgi:hypothetical protein
MGEGSRDRYPQGWCPPAPHRAEPGGRRGTRWCSRCSSVLAVGGVVTGLMSLLLAPVPALAVGAVVGVALGGGSLVAQRDLRALLARWDEEHGAA